MALALEKFVQQLEDSGILAGDTIKDFIPPKASPKDAEELARELVRKRKLTKFQAEEVSKGKGKSLVLGNYVLMEKIGAGGMGQVFKAHHRRMDRFVAVKLLPPAMTENEAAIARFEREVKAAAKISHPNIVAAHDADCANGVHFLVMELVEGQDLSALVNKNGPFSVQKAVNLILQAAKGLESAHKKGIVHRDIKPANLLLDKEGVVKILDMGLARLSLDADEAPQVDLTSTGTIMGTVDYMAPEQALDTKAADARADIYALGCSLYFLLTGKPPYEGDTLMKKLLAHREQPIPALRTVRPEVTEQLDSVFRKLVAKKLEDRYQTMTQVIVELERCSTGSTTSMTIPQPASTTFEDGSFDFLKKLPEEPTILSKPKAKAAAGKTGNNKKKLALIGTAILGVMILAGIIVSLKTKAGTLVVEINQPDATVQVLDAEGKVEISQKGGKGLVSISVDAGKHRLQIEKDGFTVFGQDFEMKSGGKTPIKAKLVPLEEEQVMAVTKPASVAEGAKKPLAFARPGFDQWVKEVQVMPAEKQLEAVSKKLQELNRGFNGTFPHKRIEEGVVTELAVAMTYDDSDISPIRALSGLKSLRCVNSIVADLSPLRGLPLTSLNCYDTKVQDLSPVTGMMLTTLELQNTEVKDLTLLRGQPLTSLNITSTKVSDLRPLQGMPLTTLYLTGSPVSDLSPLKDMPLKHLTLDFMPERDTKLLRSVKTLETINHKPIAEFWKEVEEQQKGNKLGFQIPGFDQWAKDVAAMSAEKQIEAVSKKLMELNPGFDGKITPTIENDVVKQLVFVTDDVTDISPVRALARMSSLACNGSGQRDGKLSDLSPLRGMGLTHLTCSRNPISDISPLQGMKLLLFHCYHSQISDLSVLRDMPLDELYCSNSAIADLSPLEQCQRLVRLNVTQTKVTPATVAALQKTLPNCKIEWDDPAKPNP